MVDIMSLMQSVVHVAGVAIVVMVSVFCLACGLYNAAEWLEDHVKTSARLIKRAVVLCIAVQATWLCADKSAWVPNTAGLLSHFTSCLLLQHHPHHQDNMVLTGAAVVLLAAHQTTWIYWWFLRGGSVWQTVSVLAGLVWPVPTLLLLSSASGEALPLSMRPLNTKSRNSVGALRSPLGSAQQSPTAAAAAAIGDGVAAAGDALGGIKRQVIRSATGHLHSYQKPLLPESSDTYRHRDADQADRARILALLRRGSSNAADLQQQLTGQKQHRSMVVRGIDLLRHHMRPLLPGSENDNGSGGTKGLMSKILKD